jgi:hypothetical protein
MYWSPLLPIYGRRCNIETSPTRYAGLPAIGTVSFRRARPAFDEGTKRTAKTTSVNAADFLCHPGKRRDRKLPTSWEIVFHENPLPQSQTGLCRWTLA